MTFRLESIGNFQMQLLLVLNWNTVQRQQLFEWTTNSSLRCPAVPKHRVVIWNQISCLVQLQEQEGRGCCFPLVSLETNQTKERKGMNFQDERAANNLFFSFLLLQLNLRHCFSIFCSFRDFLSRSPEKSPREIRIPQEWKKRDWGWQVIQKTVSFVWKWFSC